VTRAVEAAGVGLPRAQRIRSSSVVGLSVVTIELEWSADAALARQIAIERLSVVRDQLPAGVVPQIQPISSIMGEIMLIALTSAPFG
jgi:HME family heavy-metal exporter